MEIVSERGNKPRQAGEWVSIFTRQAWNVSTRIWGVGEWLSAPLTIIMLIIIIFYSLKHGSTLVGERQGNLEQADHL
jgi:hypothetical protein